MRPETRIFTESLLDGLAAHRITSIQRDLLVLILMDANERLLAQHVLWDNIYWALIDDPIKLSDSEWRALSWLVEYELAHGEEEA
jgi:hypothetical protein